LAGAKPSASRYDATSSRWAWHISTTTRAAPLSSAVPARKPAPVDDPKAPPELKDIRSTRFERRKATVEALKRRWGDLTANDRALEELKLHGSRVAYLQRIRVLAEKDKKQKLVIQVDELLTAEEKRHGNAMNALRGAAK